MLHIFTPYQNAQSPLNSRDCPYPTKVRTGDIVLISVVFTQHKPEAENMCKYYLSIGAKVKIGGPAYDDPGAEFCPGRFTAPGVVITHRGCVHNCPWCYVPKREGQKIRHLKVTEGNILQDNNFLACNHSHRDKVYAMLRTQRNVSLRGGLDSRLLRDSDIDAIRGLHLYDLWTAYDTKNNTASLTAIRHLRAAGIPQYKIRCYALVGFGKDTTQKATARLHKIWRAGAYPFAQLYDQYTGSNLVDWKQFARKWSRPAIYKSFFKKKTLKILRKKA